MEFKPGDYVINQSQPVKSDEIYAELMQEERVKNTISQTSPDNQLEEIEYRIKGYKRNSTTRQWEKINKTGKQEISDILVERYMAHLSSIVNDGTRYGNFSAQQINAIMKFMIEWLKSDMTIHADLYGLKGDYSERTRIGLIILNYTFSVLSRCQDGRESSKIWKALQLNENMNPNMPPQQQGIFGKLKSALIGR